MADVKTDTIETLTRRLAEVTAERDHYLSSWKDARKYVVRLTEQVESAEAERDAFRDARDMMGNKWADALARAEKAEAERDALRAACVAAREALKPFAMAGRLIPAHTKAGADEHRADAARATLDAVLGERDEG